MRRAKRSGNREPCLLIVATLGTITDGVRRWPGTKGQRKAARLKASFLRVRFVCPRVPPEIPSIIYPKTQVAMPRPDMLLFQRIHDNRDTGA
jgi:hypothetical protein